MLHTQHLTITQSGLLRPPFHANCADTRSVLLPIAAFPFLLQIYWLFELLILLGVFWVWWLQKWLQFFCE